MISFLRWGNERLLQNCKYPSHFSAKLKKNRTSLEMDIKRRLTGKNAEVESTLKLWFTNVRENDAGINGPLIRQKAKDLAKQMKKNKLCGN